MDYYKKYIKYDNKCKIIKQQNGGKKKLRKKIKDKIYDFMEYDINDLIKNSNDVKNEEDFIKFLTFLWKEASMNKEILGNNKNLKENLKKEKILQEKNIYVWANLTIHGFLESVLQAYSDHMNYNKGKIYNSENIWTKIAKIIEMGKYYE
jgi:hypothetical protein